MNISLKAYNIDSAIDQLQKLKSGQIQRVLRNAVNNSAENVREGIKDLLPRIFHRPVAYTMNSMFVKKSYTNTIGAIIGFKDWADHGTPAVKYLQAQVYGGTRRQKGAEALLSNKGKIGYGQIMTPAKKFQDSHGNARKGEINKLIAALQIGREAGYVSNARRPNKGDKRGSWGEFFISDKINGKLTIYKRVGKKAKTGMKLPRGYTPFAYITTSPNYSIRFHYHEEAKRIFDRVYLHNFEAALEQSLKRNGII